MSLFADLLRRTNDRLDLPQPTKSRILLEIAGDLEDLTRFYRDQGVGESEAVRRAIEKFDISDEALAQLAAVHESPLQRLLDRLSQQAQSRWERIILAVLLLFVAVVTGRQLFATTLFADAGRFVWPVMGTSLVALGLAISKIYVLYIKRDHRADRLRAGLSPLLILAGIDVLIGGYVSFFAMDASLRVLLMDTSPFAPPLAQWMLRAAATGTICLVAAVLTSLVWFVLAAKVAAIERAEVAYLLETEVAAGPTGSTGKMHETAGGTPA